MAKTTGPASTILSFYGDGPKWENFVYLPAYPSGCSYFRPFRYRNKWVQQGLLDQAQRNNAALDDRVVLIGARFQDPGHRWHVLPIRMGKLTRFRFADEDHSIYFRLGQFIDHARHETLAQSLLTIPDDEQGGVGDAFLFATNLNVGALPLVPEEDERNAWVSLVDRLARDDSVPISNEVRRAVFIRIQNPFGWRKAKKAKKLESTRGEGPTFGFKISEGARYEFEFAHRLPALIGTADRMPPFSVALRADSTNVQLHPVEDEVSGNYQTHFFRLAGLRRSEIAENVSIAPNVEEVATPRLGPSPVPRLKVPVRVRLNLFHRARTTWIWFVLMAAGLFLSNLVVFSSQSDVKPEDVWRFTLGSSIAALAIFFATLRSKQ